MSLSVFSPFLGCGQMMNMNDPLLQRTVITFTVSSMEEAPFFFHDDICITLRRYKEVIRRSDLHRNKEAVKPLLTTTDTLWQVAHLVANYNKLIGVKGSIPLPRPVDPHAAVLSVKPSLRSFLVKTVTSRSLRGGTKTKGPQSSKSSKNLGLHDMAELGGDDDGGAKSDYDTDADLRVIRQQREIACALLMRDQKRDQNVCSAMSIWNHFEWLIWTLS